MPGDFIGIIVETIVEEGLRGICELVTSKDTPIRYPFIILNIVVFVSYLIFKWPITILDGLLFFFISSLFSFFIVIFCLCIWRLIKYLRNLKC